MHAARPPFDPALPLVARTSLEHNGSRVEAGARVVAASAFEAATLWRAMLVDCAPADAPPVLEPVAVTVEPPPVPKPPKPGRRSSAGA